MYIAKIIGKNGEDMACRYLEEKNYKIIERNYRCKKLEVDIIAKDMEQNEIVFIEVKTRSNLKYGNPAESVFNKKQTNIILAAKYYIYINKIINFPIRFDVIEVFILKNDYKINHIKGAFSL
ncbi:MAG: YraN family protein [Clostridia bacterium]|nr:YraN family protein [Clostridia bacterium]